jgi:hypothetical protein
MKKIFFSPQVNAIADRVTKRPVKAAVAAPAPKPVPAAIQRLLASIDRNLPPPPAGTKYSVSSIDELLARQNMSTARRMEIKYSLKMHGLID